MVRFMRENKGIGVTLRAHFSQLISQFVTLLHPLYALDVQHKITFQQNYQHKLNCLVYIDNNSLHQLTKLRVHFYGFTRIISLTLVVGFKVSQKPRSYTFVALVMLTQFDKTHTKPF